MVTAVHNRIGLLTNFSLGVILRPPKREEVGRDGTHLLSKLQDYSGYSQSQDCEAEEPAPGSSGGMLELQNHGLMAWRRTLAT